MNEQRNRGASVREQLLVALDRPDLQSAQALADAVGPCVGGFKIGLELFTAEGPEAIRPFVEAGQRVFLDGKFHDIPNTVAGACRAAVRCGVWMMNIHAAGGRAMLTAASEAVKQESDRLGRPNPLLLGVTVLTSVDGALLEESFGARLNPEELVLRLARLSQDCGLDGVVASALEIRAIREASGPEFVILTPGTRRRQSGLQDQRRSATPAEALAAGASYLVIGRDVTAAPDPGAEARALLEELTGG